MHAFDLPAKRTPEFAASLFERAKIVITTETKRARGGPSQIRTQTITTEDFTAAGGGRGGGRGRSGAGNAIGAERRSRR